VSAHYFPTYRRAITRLVTLVVTCGALLAPAGALAAEKGLQTDLSWGTTAQEQERTLSALEGTNVGWIRLDISWRNTERTAGVYDADNIALTDRAVALAEQAGAKVSMVVSESPEWASGSTNPNAPPRDAADYADFVRAMAARYAGRVSAWEIWNEPNHPRFWNNAPDAAAYARLLQAAAPAVRAGDPATKVLFAGLAFNDYEYLEQVYAAAPDIGNSFDVMATHPYTDHGQSPAVVERGLDGRITKSSFLGFEEVRKVMLDHGDDRPIWLTEFGWSTNSLVTHPLGGVTEAQQAEYLGLAFAMLEEAPYVEVAVVYNFRNNYWAGDADTWEDQLGLLRTDFSPKPAYSVFKDYTPPRSEPTAALAAETPPVAQTTPAAETAPAAAIVETQPGQGAVVIPPTVPSDDRGAGPAIELSVERLASSKATASRVGSGRVSLRAVGRVSGAVGRGVVKIVLERRSRSTWKRASVRKIALRGTRFTRKLSVSRGQRWRISATYVAADGRTVSSKPVAVRG